MPTRILREGILTSIAVSKLSERAELFYRKLMSVADDYGRFFAHPALLRSHCYALRLDKISEADVKRFLSECTAMGLVRLYNNGEYLQIEKFGQQTRSKSKFPEPVERDLLSKCISVASTDAVHFVPESESESESDAKTNSKSETDTYSAKKHPTIEEVKAFCETRKLPESDAVWFWNKCEGNGWTNGGRPIKSWTCTIAAWESAGYMPSQKSSKSGENGKPLSIMDLKTVLQVKEQKAQQLKVKHTSDLAMGTVWNDCHSLLLVICLPKFCISHPFYKFLLGNKPMR